MMSGNMHLLLYVCVLSMIIFDVTSPPVRRSSSLSGTEENRNKKRNVINEGVNNVVSYIDVDGKIKEDVIRNIADDGKITGNVLESFNESSYLNSKNLKQLKKQEGVNHDKKKHKLGKNRGNNFQNIDKSSNSNSKNMKLSNMQVDANLNGNRNNKENDLGTILDDIKGDDCCIAECSLGDFVLDAFFEYGSDLARGLNFELNEDRKTHIISMLHCREIQGRTISKGPTNRERLYSYSITMGRINLLGSDIKKLIEKALWNYDGQKDHGEFYQISGMKMTIDPRKPPGNRLQSVYVNLTAQELKDNEKYGVIVSKNMEKSIIEICGLDENNKFKEATQTILDRVVYTIGDAGNITKKKDGRINILGQNEKHLTENKSKP